MDCIWHKLVTSIIISRVFWEWSPLQRYYLFACLNFKLLKATFPLINQFLVSRPAAKVLNLKGEIKAYKEKARKARRAIQQWYGVKEKLEFSSKVCIYYSVTCTRHCLNQPQKWFFQWSSTKEETEWTGRAVMNRETWVRLIVFFCPRNMDTGPRRERGRRKPIFTRSWNFLLSSKSWSLS